MLHLLCEYNNNYYYKDIEQMPNGVIRFSVLQVPA